MNYERTRQIEMKDNKKQTKLAAWLWYAILWCPCYAISQVLFRYRFSGKNHVPLDGPVLLVSNHQSNLDPVLVGLACPRQLKYLARVGLFFFPFNLWIRALGAFPIDRERGALAGIRATLNLLKENNAVLIFPEGSRTYDGGLQPMLPGFCLLARRKPSDAGAGRVRRREFAALPAALSCRDPTRFAWNSTRPFHPLNTNNCPTPNSQNSSAGGLRKPSSGCSRN